MTTEERNKRVEEVVEIRNLLERFAERGYTDKASDLDIYRMFGTLTKEMARSMASGMTFTLHALELPEPPAYRPYLDELVRIHCKAEGPVSVSSIYHYLCSQLPVRPTLDDVDEAIDRLVSRGVVELYDADDQMKTYL